MDENKTFELNDDELDAVAGGAGASDQPAWAGTYPDGCRIRYGNGCNLCRDTGVKSYYGTLRSQRSSTGTWWWKFRCDSCGVDAATSSQHPDACNITRA